MDVDQAQLNAATETDFAGFDAHMKFLFAKDRLMSFLGAELVSAQPGKVVLKYEVGQESMQIHGTCHGGVLFTLADAAFGLASSAPDRLTVSHNCDITYMRPAGLGEVLLITATERSHAGRNRVVDVVIETQSGKVVAEFRGLARVINPKG